MDAPGAAARAAWEWGSPARPAGVLPAVREYMRDLYGAVTGREATARRTHAAGVPCSRRVGLRPRLGGPRASVSNRPSSASESALRPPAADRSSTVADAACAGSASVPGRAGPSVDTGHGPQPSGSEACCRDSRLGRASESSDSSSAAGPRGCLGFPDNFGSQPPRWAAGRPVRPPASPWRATEAAQPARRPVFRPRVGERRGRARPGPTLPRRVLFKLARRFRQAHSGVQACKQAPPRPARPCPAGLAA